MFAKVGFIVTAGLYTDFLNYMLENDFLIFKLETTQLGFTAFCYAEDYKRIAAAARRFQCRIRMTSKTGIYFRLRRYKDRKGIIVGAALFMTLSFLFSNIIWNIQINADSMAMKNEISVQLYRQGITAGTFYTKDKLQQARDNIIALNSSISHISLNFYKGMLKCEVYPRNQKADYISDLSDSDIFSSMSGIISDLRVYSGYSVVELGQSVSRGDLLVSHITSDVYGNTYKSDTRAYIEALCDKSYTIYIPFSKTIRVMTGHKAETVYLEFLDNTICLKDDDITGWADSMDNTEIEYCTVMGFHLPVTVRRITHYRLENVVIDNDTLTARNVARLQLQHMIDNDVLLKKEINRSYDYILDDNGLQLNCMVTGHYQIT